MHIGASTGRSGTLEDVDAQQELWLEGGEESEGDLVEFGLEGERRDAGVGTRF